MKKIIFSILASAMILSACATKPAVKETTKGDAKKKVVATTVFVADMIKEVSNDIFDVEVIIPAGEDPHVYLPKASDVDKIESADLLLYHGLHFEGRMQDILDKKGKAVTVNFKEDELNKMEEDGEEITDPHFWFDINLYKLAVKEVAKNLSELEPSKKDEIEANFKTYEVKLDELHEYNKKLLDEIPAENRYLITPHDAFNYFSSSYGIEVVAPQGVSTESEVSNKDIEDTADFIVAHKVKAIFTESTTNPERILKLQEIVKAKGFDVKVVSGEGNELFSDSLAPLGEEGDNYIDMYKHNVELMNKNLK